MRQTVWVGKLADPSLFEKRAYLNGEWISKEDTFAMTNIATGEVIASTVDMYGLTGHFL